MPARSRAGSLRPRSVRARTTLAATLIVTVAFAAGGTVLYVLLHRALTGEVADRTELAARRVAGPASDGPLPRRLPRAGESVDLVQVVGRDGAVIASNGLIGEGQPLATFRPPRDDDSASRVVSDPGFAHGARAEVVVVRAQTRDGPVYVYAATAFTQADRAAGFILRAMLYAAPVFIAMVAAVTWWATRRAFRPVEAIRAELASITARALGRRVPEPPTGDEVADLARTVNHTLDRLDHAVARQRQFVSDASHELRNPIASLRLQMEVALAETDPCEPVHRTVGEALADTERLEALAGDLLLLARLEGRPDGGGAPVDLGLLAAEEVARRRRTRVPVRLDIADGVHAAGDERHLSRLLANLLDNAQRYARHEVTVRVRADEPSGHAVLEVADDGPGVPPADRERVFERFTRLDEARGRETGGAGLGLAIAREIAGAHAGTLTVEDGDAGADGDAGPGARFVTRLPLLDG